MTDLRVDDHILADSERRLTRLHTEFQNLDQQRDDLHGIWGSGDVADAMDDFFDNWRQYRKKLVSSIEDVGKLVSGTREAFARTDDKLAKASQPKGNH